MPSTLRRIILQGGVRQDALARVSVALGCVYLVLLPMDIPLYGPVFLHDLLAPCLLVVVLLRGRFPRFFRWPDALLGLFLVTAALTTLVHLGGMRDVFEWAIFAYMGVLYWFFADCPMPARGRLWIGLATLGAASGCVLFNWLNEVRTSYEVYEGSTLGFMANRFFFSFSHPNLAGSFYVLPVVLVLTALIERGRRFTGRQALLATGCSVLFLVPLVLTVSRHMLLTGAVGLGFLVWLTGRRRAAWVVSWVCLAIVFTLFYLTILFPFFPLQATAPFFNHRTMGMYMIHQAIYVKVLLLGTCEFLLGVGKTSLLAIYPELADWDSAYAVLAQYRQEFLTESFVTYMDAHNEYLNLATAFGVPAMGCCVAFWVRAFRGYRRSPFWPMAVFFVSGVLLACLWDDLLSKRWMWVGLGILTALCAQQQTPAGAGPQPEGE